VFLLDDDSLLHRTCAEKILEVYDTDERCEVAGVQASVVEETPDGVLVPIERKQTGADSWRWTRGNAVVETFYRRILLMNRMEIFIPYDGELPRLAVPDALARLNVTPVSLFWGCAMTFRRSVIAEVGFEPCFIRYAAGEDHDASYRASRRGALLIALDARLKHVAAASGRTSRFATTALSALNQAFLLRKHSTDLNRDLHRYDRLMRRRLLAELLKDLLSGRWTFPQAKGIGYSIRTARELFQRSMDELPQWYGALQAELLDGKERPDARLVKQA
jgi:GT2 family glycosyltransferase